MIRARTLLPLRNGSATLTAKPTAGALTVLTSRSVSRKACEIAARRSQSPRPPIVLVIFHRELCSEFAARVAILASVHYRTDAGQKPGRTPDSSTRGGNGPDSASSRNPRRINTFTRRAPYCTRREPISSRRPATALFSVVTNKLPKVAVQLPIGDDVSPSSPCEAWLGFDFQSFHSVKQPPPHWPLHVLIA